MQVDDNLRERINSARRQNYSDDVIASVLAETMPKVQMALDERINPSIILDELASPPTMLEKTGRMAGIAARGATEALAPVAAGALAGGLIGGPPGAAVGAVAMPLAQFGGDIIASGSNRLLGTNFEMPSQTISQMIPGPRPETPTERVIETAGGALGGTVASVGAARQLARMPTVSPTGAGVVTPGQQAVGQELSRAPVGQITTAPVAAGVGQTVTEDTENPLLGLGASLVTGGAMGLRSAKYETVSAEDVLNRAKTNYKTLDESGFKLGLTSFKQNMANSVANIKGYDARTMPDVAVAIEHMLSNKPKTVQELEVVRQFLTDAAKSNKAGEVRVANRLLEEFDDYVLNAKPNQIVSGTRDAMDAWSDARMNYSRFKKSEIFRKIISDSELAPSSPESFMKNELVKLAKNDRKMRLFSKEEQAAIREAAMDDSLQKQLRLVAKFTPMTPAAAIFTAVSPFGAYTAAAGLTAKELAARRRLMDVAKLKDRMLMGRQPKQIEGPFRNLPVYTGRAALNMLSPELIEGEPRNALGR